MKGPYIKIQKYLKTGFVILIVITVYKLGPTFIFVLVRATKKMVKIESSCRVFKLEI